MIITMNFDKLVGFGNLWAARITQWNWEHPKLSFGVCGQHQVELHAEVGEVIRFGRKCYADPSKSRSAYGVVQMDGQVTEIDRVHAKSRWTELQIAKTAAAQMQAKAQSISPSGISYLASLKAQTAVVSIGDLPSDAMPYPIDAQEAAMVARPLPQPEAPKVAPRVDLVSPPVPAKTYTAPKRKPPTVL